MASLLRFARQSCQVIRSNPALARRVLQPSCFISTSKKNKDALAGEISDVVSPRNPPRRPRYVDDPISGPNTAGGRPEVHETVLETQEDEKNWISFGYDTTNRDEDEWAHHAILFSSITIALVMGAYYLAYMPDYRMREWAQREAYLELARREAAGLPLVDANLVAPEKIDLPSEEELGDTEIVI